MLNPLTPLRTSRPRSRTKKESLPINKDSSLLENNWKTAELSLTTIFKKNQLSTWFWDWEEECRFSSKHWLERLLLLTLNLQTLLKTSKLRSKIRKVSHPINKDSSSLGSNWKMEEHWVTTTSRRNPLFTWSWDSEAGDYSCYISIILNIFG